MRYHLTFDIDWAPDFCVAEILQWLSAKNIKGTFFVTHQSDILRDVEAAGHQLGIHPNFFPHSTQGESPEQVIENLLKIIPDANAVRIHGLYQSTPLLSKIFGEFQQLKYDFSVFMYGFPLIQRFRWAFDQVSFLRLNYNWEDDAAFFDTNFIWDEPLFFSNLNVYNFHPVHIALNSDNAIRYRALKGELNETPLWKANKMVFDRNTNTGIGAKTFLQSLTNCEASSLDFESLVCESA